MIFENDGYCTICENTTRFIADKEWLRDHYYCPKCFSIPRQRALIEVLKLFLPNWPELIIHESSPTMKYLSERCSNYTFSFFFEDTVRGQFKEGQRCEDLEQLTFSDNTFDIFISQDVLEHLFDPEKAMTEIMRVLQPNGTHIFTTPKHKTLLKSFRRARRVDGKIEYLYEPVYHGNPIGDKQSLVTWDFGADFDDLVQKWSGFCTSNLVIRDRRLGIDGEFLEVFLTRKSEENRLTRS